MAEDTTVYINDHNHNAYIEEGPSASDVLKGDKDMYKIKFFPSGESLSDMIFKSSKQSIVAEGLSSQYRPKIDIPNPARIRATATKASLTLSSDSSSSELSAVSNTSGSESGDQEQDIEETPAVNNVSNMSSDEPVSQETVIADLGMVSMRSLDVIPKDQSQLRSDTMEILSSDEESVNAPRQDTDSSEMIKSTSVRRILHDYEDPSSHDWADEPSGLPPQMQPNSSDSSSSLSSSSLSSISSSSSTPRREDPHENIFRRQSHSRNKIVLTNGFGDMTPPEVLAKTLSESSSIPQSMTSNSFSQPTPISVLPPPPSPPSPPFPASSTYPTSIHPLSSTVMPPIENITNTSFIPVSRSKPRIVSSPLQYWRSRTSNGIESPVSTMPSFPQSYIASPFSKKKKFTVPTIVLHPDEEDGESPRVLSQKDIDYLTTMPPAPLRLLVQPWDEGAEDDEYEDRAINEGYDYDEYHRHHHEAFEHGIEGEDFGEVEMDGYNDCELRDSEEFDPYALDVPIDLDVDLQELGRNTFKSGYGYI
ncbi:hypothetical protein BGZ49_009586 [Haplosporangium sp. Z 27]|nr:hypothetical protein BGZ49_009586 [Haplosporangium sp. Z 27]